DHHHNEEIASCTESDEANACHRSLIHFDTEAGCDHTKHLNKVVASCEICDALISNYLFEVSLVGSPPFQYNETEPTESPQKQTIGTSLAIPSLRGPPALS